MDPGWTSLCLKVKDLDASRRFYEALGMEVLEVIENKRVVLRSGSFRLALMNFLDAPLLNIRGADVFETQARLKQALPFPVADANAYTAEQVDSDADGTCFTLQDPDGFAIFVDTNQHEEGQEGRQRRIDRVLYDARLELENAGAPRECLEALETHLIAKFATPGRTSEI